ncbi:MAG TPA: hypothetical protein VGI60_01815 [Chthoniobacterales bacterium]|jgi:hypothetical protein
MSAQTEDDDWRLQGQEKHLMDVSLVHRPYRRYTKNPEWDHDHCAFCWAKFMVEDYPDVLHEGYATPDDYHWVCDQCFHDFRERFHWQVVDDSTQKT